MKLLGLDLGTKTLGISITDKTNTLVRPYKVIRFNREDYESVIPELKEIINKEDIGLCVLGFPKNMDGSIGFAGERSKNFQKLLSDNNIKNILYDERLTTKISENIIHDNNSNVKDTKNKIDAIAASVILEDYIRGNNDIKE